MTNFVTLSVDTGPSGICSIEMPGATSLRYAALRLAEHIGLDTEQKRYFLLNPATMEQYSGDELSSDYDGTVFFLGEKPL